MLSRTRNIFKLASTSRNVVWARSYHTFPDPSDKGVITVNRSETAKTIDKNSPSYKLASSFRLENVFPGTPVSGGIGKKSPPPTLVTKLNNGLSVATQEMPGMMSSFALIVRSGSSYEKQGGSEDETGLTHFLEMNAFRTSKNRTHAEFMAEMELLGGMVQCISNRENILYCVDVLRNNTEQALALLADTILNPLFPDNEIQESRETAAFQHAEIDANVISRDFVQIAAYQKQPLGNIHFCPLDRIENITADKLKAFHAREIYGGNCVMAAAGVEHDEFVQMVGRQFSALPNKGVRSQVDTVRTPSVFTGGLVTEQRELKEPFTKVTIGFEVGGWNDPHLVANCVLQQLLGGGSSFSAGGPGKGMYSRLYTDVLNRAHWVESVEAFMTVNESNGLLGIDGACPPEYVTNMIRVIIEQLTMISYHPTTEEQLSRAKNMLKSMMMMQLESRLVVCEDIGRQFVTYGKRESPASLCDKIDAVTAQDLMNVGRRILSCPPAVAVVGTDITQCPPYEQIHEFVNRYRAEYIKKFTY